MLDFFDYRKPDNQAQDLKYQINQYLSEILIVTLATATHGFNYPVFRYYSAILAFSPSCFLTLSLLRVCPLVCVCVRWALSFDQMPSGVAADCFLS